MCQLCGQPAINLRDTFPTKSFLSQRCQNLPDQPSLSELMASLTIERALQCGSYAQESRCLNRPSYIQILFLCSLFALQ